MIAPASTFGGAGHVARGGAQLVEHVGVAGDDGVDRVEDAVDVRLELFGDRVLGEPGVGGGEKRAELGPVSSSPDNAPPLTVAVPVV